MNLNAEEFKQKRNEEEGMVIDVRTAKEYGEGHLRIADYNFDYTSGEFEQRLDELDKEETYYLHCRSGNRSGKAAELMKKHGFKHVYNVGGYEELVRAGFEPEK